MDQDLAARNNRIQNPLSSQFAVSGCPTKSQAARIAIARAREEMGGVNQSEQDTARVATWRSTILALDTEAGSVVSIADPDVPGGAMNFRVQSMRINRDWSVDLVGKTVTASMYDATVGPKPADVSPSPVPAEPVRDSDVPPEPFFGANLPNSAPAGYLELVGLSFPSAENTRYISSGTFSVYYVEGNADAHLAAAISDTDASISVDAWGAIVTGDLIEIDGEVLLVGAVTDASADVTRAQKAAPSGSAGAAAAHAAGAEIRKVEIITRNESFPAGFFDGIGTEDVNPLLISWTLDIPLPNTRVLAADGVVMNPYGPSPVGTVNWTQTTDNGILVGNAAESASRKTIRVTSDCTLTAESQCVEADAALGSFTIRAPDAGAIRGVEITVTRVDATVHVVTIAAADGQTIGATGASSLDLVNQGDSISFEGSNA